MKAKYRYFEVTKSTTDDDLKKQFRELSKQLHPDREGGSEEAFTDMMKEYEIILRQRSGRSITGIRDRIRDELSDFYERIAPELVEYKPEFLQLYDDLWKLADKGIERGFVTLAKKLNIPPHMILIGRKYVKRVANQQSKKVRGKLEKLGDDN